MAPYVVAAYRRGGKNDSNDAEAICEVLQRPSMRFVPVKSLELQAVLTVHRVRQNRQHRCSRAGSHYGAAIYPGSG
jgi:transposase